jgi:phytoene synthase
MRISVRSPKGTNLVARLLYTTRKLFEGVAKKQSNKEWNESQWREFDQTVHDRILTCTDDETSWSVLARSARKVLKHYSTSFFIVTRFLPVRKRQAVEIIYAAVRYPDEVVDTFDLGKEAKRQRLRSWREAYASALRTGSIRKSIQDGLPVFASGFAEVVRHYGIPPEHYHSFLDAMEMDVEPRTFGTIEDLIESYIYGSAVVVGYFLSYVYGARAGADFDRALRSSRYLAMALQLTNFLRDVQEDRHRSRLYLPVSVIEAEGISVAHFDAKANREAQRRVVRRLSAEAEYYYSLSEEDIEAFSPDCLSAIQACVGVYRALTSRIADDPEALSKRVSLPLTHKFRYLPTSKYWRIPLSYVPLPE